MPADTAGACILEWRGLQFKAGFGESNDAALKQEWWDNRKELTGTTMTFCHQELSPKGVPRFGKAEGFRHAKDIS